MSKRIFCSTPLKLVLALFVLSSALRAQAEVGYPSWTNPLPIGTPYLPPEYVGGYPAKASIPQIKMGTLGKISLWTSPVSGVFALRDFRVDPVAKKGWDTGRDRVYSLIPVLGSSGFPVQYTCILWNATSSKSEIVRISIDSNFGITQSPPLAISDTNEIWLACGIVDPQTLYVYDVASHSIKRLKDSSNDGVFDLVDTGFNLSIPMVWVADGSLSSQIVERFWYCLESIDPPKTPGSIARLRMAVPKAPGLDLFETAGIPSIQLVPSSGTPLPQLNIVGLVVIGQKRLLVDGTANTSFRIHSIDDLGVDTEISRTWTISASGATCVDLKFALTQGTTVFAKATESDTESRKLKPVVTMPSTLLHPVARRLEEGASYQFFGERLHQGLQAYCILKDGTTLPLQTQHSPTTRSVGIVMPDLGEPGVAGPSKNLESVEIVMKDTTTLQIATQPIELQLFYR